MEKQRLEDREINYVRIGMSTDGFTGEINEGYSLEIISSIGTLDITSPGGVDDISLIQDCISNTLDDIAPLEEGYAVILLKESGEWEDVFWHKYYEVVSVFRYEMR